MRSRYILILAFLFVASHVMGAQQYMEGAVKFENPESKKEDGNVLMETTVNLQELQMHRQQMVILTPVLRSADEANEIAFDPIVIMGKVRDKAVARDQKLNGFRFDPEPMDVLVYNKKRRENIDLRLETPYQPWMRDAELVFNEDVCGCGKTMVAENQYLVITPILPPVFVPVYNLIYLEPPTEEVKVRSESYAARINFVVDKYDINRNYRNNAAILDEVDEKIREINGDPNLTITEFNVTGYASPEGGAAHNMKLSENRASSFVNYVQARHNIRWGLINVDWKGDDWDGLRKLMDASNFEDRGQVLDILDFSTDSQYRKTKLRNMSSYRSLVGSYYPELRRNEYTISYVARPFSIEEAKEIIKTKPQQLSLNEMYLVANTYPKDSKEFKEVFDIAARLFPTDPYANLNTAALDAENGAYDAALERLAKVDTPEAWSNMGYIYIQKGRYEKAAEYFGKAADAGVQVAQENLRNLNLWLEDTK